MKLTTGTSAQRTATTSRETPFSGDPITAVRVAEEGLRPSDPDRPICTTCNTTQGLAYTGRHWLCAACWQERYGTPQPGTGVRPPRVCACGCGRSLEGRRKNTRYALAACRPRTNGEVAGSGSGRGRSEASLRERAGGLQVSYRKAVRAVVAEFGTRAEVVLRSALSETQRARLDEREAA